MTSRKSIAAMIGCAPPAHREALRATITSLSGRAKQRLVRQLAAVYRVTEGVTVSRSKKKRISKH
jgi:acyl-CoA hydrolase